MKGAGGHADRFVLAAILLLVAVLAVTCVTPEITMNPASRLATVDALVHRGTFCIDGSRYAYTVDKVVLDGRAYSSKPPMLSVLLAGPYWLCVHAAGWTFETHERACVVVLSVLGAGLPHLLLVWYLYRCLALLGADAGVRAWGVAAAGLGYLGLAYVGGVNNHTPGAAALCAAFYHTVRIRTGQNARERDWWLAGAAAGLAPTLELPAALFSAVFGAALLLHDWRRTLTRFVPAALPFAAAHLWFTQQALGGVLPAYLRRGVHRRAATYWVQPQGIDAIREPKAVYALHALLGHHGLFSMMPVLVLAPVGAWHWWRARKPGGRELAAALAAAAVVIAALVLHTRNYGGTCVGFRWFLFLAPLLFLAAALALDRLRGRGWRVAFALGVTVGALHVADALPRPYGPWFHSRWHAWFARHGLGSVPVEFPSRAP